MAYIHKPTPTNWYYCIDADDPILPGQIPSGLACNWLSFSLEDKGIEDFKSSDDYAGLTETLVGKWIIFPPNPDDLWPALLKATAEGNLGISIKASTPYCKGNLICVYTYDYRDKEDTDRVYDALRALGIGGRLSYKPDEWTYEGRSGSIWTALPGERPHRPKNWRG